MDSLTTPTPAPLAVDITDGRRSEKMTWADNPSHPRSVSSEGYVLTWAYNSHGTWFNAWARRKEGERRGKHLGAGYSRVDCEAACERHFEKVSRGTVEHA